MLYKTLKVHPSTTGPTQWYNTASRSLSNQLFVVKISKPRPERPTDVETVTQIG